MDHDIEPHKKSNEITPTQWLNFAIAIIGGAAALAGTGLNGPKWIIYIGIAIAIVAVLATLKDSWPLIFIKNQIHKSSDESLFADISKKYESLLDEFAVVEDLAKLISELIWEPGAQRNYNYPHNQVEHFRGILSTHKKPYALRVMYMNHILDLHVQRAEMYFSECAPSIQQRKATYKDEHQKAEMQRLLNKYYVFRDEHDSICNKLNKNLKQQKLKPFYGRTFAFSPTSD
ncbi:hypothetical protein [Pseudoteredinibacter isoporae]|uniref:hypothetical protein n=1 Tax=Pseudoteredinibacter isoporae TaxID=570281 RepID=UPI00310C3E20